MQRFIDEDATLFTLRMADLSHFKTASYPD
jgi:hypothetical protein